MKVLTALVLLLMTTACSRGGSATDQHASEPAARVEQERGAAPVATVESQASVPAQLPRVDGARAMQYAREIVAIGARPVGSAGHRKLEAYLRSKLKGDNLTEDAFAAGTPAGRITMRNVIAKFPGTKDGIIVVSGHYDTLYSNRQFVGANDGGSSTALLLALADQLRGRKSEGYSVWLVFFDGEEAIQQWSETDSKYGSRHLASKWAADGTAKKIKALFNVDMIGDADLNIDRDLNSSPELMDLIYAAASKYGYQSHFFARANSVDDDHIPFAQVGVPVADIIDFNYGYENAYWHTEQDTLDKLSPRSFEIVGSVVLQAIKTLDSK